MMSPIGPDEIVDESEAINVRGEPCVARLVWAPWSTRSSLSANPSKIGIFMDNNTANVANGAYFHFVRLCTSGACVSAPWPIGE